MSDCLQQVDSVIIINIILLFVSGFQSVLSVVLNNSTGNFDEKVVIHSFNDFFTSTSWLGFTISILSIITSQLVGFLADRYAAHIIAMDFI